jgi:hypothetical protein
MQMPMLSVLCQIVPGVESIFHNITTSPIDVPDAALLMKRERIRHNKPDSLLCKGGGAFSAIRWISESLLIQ